MPRPTGHGPGYAVRRGEVIDIAAELFSRKGYAATGVAELCRATGLAKGALYYYIGSKPALLVEIHSSVLGPLLAAAQRIAVLPDTAPALRLRLLSETLLEVIEHRLDYIRVVEHEIQRITGSSRNRLIGDRRRFEDLVAALHAEAMHTGAFRPLDPRMCMLQFFNLHNYTFQWLRPGPWDAQYLSAEYCAVLFRGFAAPGFDPDGLEAEVTRFRAGYAGPSLSGVEQHAPSDDVATDPVRS